MHGFLIQTLDGLTFAGLLFLLGSGFTLIFGLMRIVNLAHGGTYLVGGYIGYSAILATHNVLLGLAAGVATLRWPVAVTEVLYLIIAFWAIFTGILRMVVAIRLRDLIPGEWWLFTAGLASIAFGVLLLMYPGPGLLAVIWLIGLYAVIYGIASIMAGYRLKGLAGELPAPLGHARAG
jgi:uncharacterized membrane protein HdeD (DUF308 family)